jgi:hypothetical protein
MATVLARLLLQLCRYCSPFVDNRLAVATAQNFGIIGNGRLHVLEVRRGLLDPGQQRRLYEM